MSFDGVGVDWWSDEQASAARAGTRAAARWRRMFPFTTAAGSACKVGPGGTFSSRHATRAPARRAVPTPDPHHAKPLSPLLVHRLAPAPRDAGAPSRVA